MKYFIFLCCLFLFSCENDRDYYEYVSNDLKSFADFKVGSYWIYQLDSSSIIDTIKVIDHKTVFEARQSDSRIAHDETIQMTLKSSYDSSLIYDEIDLSGLNRRIYKYFADDTVDWSDFTHVYYKIGTYNYNSVKYLFNYNFRGIVYDTLIYLNTPIYKTYKHKEAVESRADIYFSLHKGIIYRSYYDSEKRVSWYLIDEKIIK